MSKDERFMAFVFFRLRVQLPVITLLIGISKGISRKNILGGQIIFKTWEMKGLRPFRNNPITNGGVFYRRVGLKKLYRESRYQKSSFT